MKDHEKKVTKTVLRKWTVRALALTLAALMVGGVLYVALDTILTHL